MNRRTFTKIGLAGVFAPAVFRSAYSQTPTIEVWSHFVPGNANPREKAISSLAQSFEAKNPHIKVKFNSMPWEQVGPTLLRASKSGQVPDVASIYSPTVPQLAAAGALDSLEPYLKKVPDREDMVRLRQSEDSQGNVYALPYQLIVSGLTYRADLLEKAGKKVPKTLDEWSEVASEFIKDGTIGISLGFNTKGAPIPSGWFLSTLLGMGATIIDADGKPAFDSPQARKLLEWVRAQVNDRKTIPADVALMDQEQTQDLFIAKRAVFLPSSTQRAFVIRDKGQFGSNIKMTSYPGTEPNKPSPAHVQAWNLTIPKGAKHPDAAWAFIEHWTSKDVQLDQTRIAGLVPMRGSVLTDPVFNDPQLEIVKWAAQYAKSSPMDFKFPSNTEEMYDVWMRMFGQVITSKIEASQALKNAEQDYIRRSRR